MEMRKCLNGHYYDASMNQECPYCTGKGSQNVTVPLNLNNTADSGRTLPLGFTPQSSSQVTSSVMGQQVGANLDRTMPLNLKPADSEEGRTVAIIRQDMGIDPVVGWLVCIEGEEKGRDYKIHSDNNFVGRSEKMDICIRGDETISRENHVIVSYDRVDGTFYCSPGDGRSIVRVNDKAIFQTVELKAYDKIVLGKTILSFVPFCGKDFDWKEE